LPAILCARFFVTAAFLGVDSFVPLAADRIHGAPPIAQGFTIAGAAGAWTAGQAVAARRKLSLRRATAAGFAVMLVGILGSIPVISPGWPLPCTFVTWCFGGFGIGLLFNPTTVGAMGTARPDAEGLIGSQLQMADALGFATMSLVGGVGVTLADRTSLDLAPALACNFALAALCAVAGLFVSRRIA
jgi:hypothetical protein